MQRWNKVQQPSHHFSFWKKNLEETKKSFCFPSREEKKEIASKKVLVTKPLDQRNDETTKWRRRRRRTTRHLVGDSFRSFPNFHLALDVRQFFTPLFVSTLANVINKDLLRGAKINLNQHLRASQPKLSWSFVLQLTSSRNNTAVQLCPILN